MSELKPLPKEVTNEIRFILEGCRDGRLEHNQEEFHCGSAHCISGWKEVMDYSKTATDNVTADDITHTSGFRDWERQWEKALTAQGVDTPTTWDYARHQWGLTYKEAYELFWDKKAFPEQFAMLEKLEAGERVQWPSSPTIQPSAVARSAPYPRNGHGMR